MKFGTNSKDFNRKIFRDLGQILSKLLLVQKKYLLYP